MSKKSKNVFISHIHEDDAGLGALKDLLSKHGMDIKDSSINALNPNNAHSEDYIKDGILTPKIKWAGTLLVYVTTQTKTSDWVNWEIEKAHKLGKRIVGVWAYGENDCELPEALNNYADAVVGWNGSSICDAVEGTSDIWEQPDGTECKPRSISRHPCGS